MHDIMESRGRAPPQENENQESQELRDQKRMYSFRQMFDLHKILNNNSDVHDRVTQNETDLKKVFQEIASLKS